MEKERKVVFITGCSSGFGLLMAVAFLKSDYFVIASMRDISKKEVLLNAIDDVSLLKYLDIQQLDVLNYQHGGKQLSAILDTHPRIDIFINNAGVIVSGMIDDLNMKDVQYQFDVNVVGSFWLVKEVTKNMIKTGSGKIIFISSLAGRRALPMQSAYHASKFALEGFAESLFLELAPYYIDVSLIEPGVYETKVWNNAVVSLNKEPNHYKRKFYQYADRFKEGKNPNQVVEKVLKVANSKHPKLHYVFGLQNRVFISFKNIIYSRFTKLGYRNFFKF